MIIIKYVSKPIFRSFIKASCCFGARVIQPFPGMPMLLLLLFLAERSLRIQDHCIYRAFYPKGSSHCDCQESNSLTVAKAKSKRLLHMMSAVTHCQISQEICILYYYSTTAHS